MTQLLRGRISTAIASIAIFLGAGIQALAAEPENLDEVVVEGAAVALHTLRAEITQLEDRIYERYNEANKKDKFDIECEAYARTGTRFVKRACNARFVNDAIREEGKSTFEQRQFVHEQFAAGVANPITNSSPPPPALMMTEFQRPEFRRNFKKVAESDPELQRLLKQFADLVQNYDEARRGDSGGARSATGKDAVGKE